MKKILHWYYPTTKELRYSKEIDTKKFGDNHPNTTEKEPLKAKEGFAVCFISNDWKYVEDNRTKDIHNTETKENSICDYLGALKTGFALGKYIKTESELLAAARSIKVNEINEICEKTIISNFTSLALGTNHSYQSDRDDQTNLMGLVIDNKDDLLKCTNLADTTTEWVIHTAAELRKVFEDGKRHKKDNLIKAQSLKNFVTMATTVEAIEQVIWE